MINISNLPIFSNDSNSKEIIEKCFAIVSSVLSNNQTSFTSYNQSTNSLKENKFKECLLIYVNKLSYALLNNNFSLLQNLITEIPNFMVEQLRPKEWPELDNRLLQKLKKDDKFYYDIVKFNINLKISEYSFSDLKSIYTYYYKYIEDLLEEKFNNSMFTPTIIYMIYCDFNLVYNKIISYKIKNKNIENNSIRKSSTLSNENNNRTKEGKVTCESIENDVQEIIEMHYDIIELLKEADSFKLTDIKELSNINDNYKKNDYDNLSLKTNINILCLQSCLFKSKLNNIENDYYKYNKEKALDTIMKESEYCFKLIRNTQYYSNYVKHNYFILYLELLLERILIEYLTNKLIVSDNEVIYKILFDLKEAWDVVKCASTFYNSNKKSNEYQLLINIFKPTIQSLIVYSLIFLCNNVQNVRINLILKSIELKNRNDLKYNNSIAKVLSELNFPFYENISSLITNYLIEIGVKRNNEFIEEDIDNILNREIKAFNIFSSKTN